MPLVLFIVQAVSAESQKTRDFLSAKLKKNFTSPQINEIFLRFSYNPAFLFLSSKATAAASVTRKENVMGYLISNFNFFTNFKIFREKQTMALGRNQPLTGRPSKTFISFHSKHFFLQLKLILVFVVVLFLFYLAFDVLNYNRER